MRTHVINKWPLHIFTHTLTLLSFNRSFSYNYKKKWTALLWMKMYTLFFLSETFHALDKFKWITPTPLLNLSFAAHQFLWNKYKFVINDDRHWRFKCLLIASRMFNTEYARWHITFHTFGYGIESLLHVYKNWNSG